MFALIWITVFVSVRGSSADTGAPLWMNSRCRNGFCISLKDGLIRAEAGLCVVIPCNFTASDSFTPQHIVWYKCGQSKTRCQESDMIFNTDKTSEQIKSGYEGRVSLLEPAVNQRSCSIMINDLNKSDSGWYQLRFDGLLNGKTGRLIFVPKTQISVRDLKQKPTVMIPPLTEGQQTTLTCTAPGLCSGSPPEITWMWREAGEEDFYIPGNITAVHTENLTAVSQRHSSSLTFNLSAEHHNTNVTCKISFTGNTATEETVTLQVNYMKEIKISVDENVKEGKPLNLTCSVDSFPPSLISWTRSGPETNLRNDSPTVQQNNSATCWQQGKGICSLYISNLTAEDSGLYICNVKHLDITMTEEVNVALVYKRKAQISGRTTMKTGEVLNLTCSVESFPPSLIMWTKQSSNTSLQSGISLLNDTGSATLVISNVTAEDSGQYVCTATHLNTTTTEYADVTVTWFSGILTGSGCVLQSAVLTCVCVSEGFPLPSIKWPLLQGHTSYSVRMNVSHLSVTSTITLSMKSQETTTVVCVSSNDAGAATRILAVNESQESGHRFSSGELLLSVAVVSLFVNIILTIFCVFLLTSRQKVKPNKEEKIYMSLHRKDTSDEYDVIGQPSR